MCYVAIAARDLVVDVINSAVDVFFLEGFRHSLKDFFDFLKDFLDFL